MPCPFNYGYKMILDHTNNFGQVSSFGQVQIIKISPEKSNLNDLDPTKTIRRVQNNFGPIEGQGISVLAQIGSFK